MTHTSPASLLSSLSLAIESSFYMQANYNF